MTQQPTVGRTVHYHSLGSADGRFPSEPRAAIVTEVPELTPSQPNSGPPGYVKSASLAVLNPTGMHFQQCVRYSEGREPGTWSWPPRS
jgi:hypothetical protein